MKIKSLQISNIWSFKYVEDIANAPKISFDKNFNILIGQNGAGKSTALEVINFIFRRVLFVPYNRNSDLYSQRTNIDSNQKKTILAKMNNIQYYRDFRLERNYDFEWCCQARLDEVDAPLLKKMKQAKCRLIHYGVETASDKMLRLAHKGLTTERITEGIRLTQEAGIKTLCFFMIGLSSDSREEMRQNMAFAHRLNPTYLHYHLAVSYGASCIQENSLNLPCDVSRRMIKHAIMKFYLRPRYIIQRLKQKEDRKAMLRQLKLLYAYIR